MYSSIKSVAKRRSRRSLTVKCRRAGRKIVGMRSKRYTPRSAQVVLGPVSGKLDKGAVFEAALIRNRTVLEELAKH
jgi:hypothetical protein